MDFSFGCSVIRGDCLADSEPSFDSARGVSGGVFFVREGGAPSVSLACSRCVVKEERAVFAGVSVIGVLDVVDGREEVGFEMCAAWTDELVVMLDKGFDPPERRRVRNGMTTFPDGCRNRQGRQATSEFGSVFWGLPSLPALALRVEDDEDDGGGVG